MRETGAVGLARLSGRLGTSVAYASRVRLTIRAEPAIRAAVAENARPLAVPLRTQLDIFSALQNRPVPLEP